MKFTCDACKARYVIDDAKVRGKVLSIKCKKCGNLISVREPTQATSPKRIRKSAVRATTALKGIYHEEDVDFVKKGSRRKRRSSQTTRFNHTRQASRSGEERLSSTNSRTKTQRSRKSKSRRKRSSKTGLHRTNTYQIGTQKTGTSTQNLEQTEQWYYAINGKTFGPYSEEELLKRFSSGKIGDEAFLWQQGFVEWKPANKIPVFATILDKQQSEPRRSRRTMQVDVDDLFSVRSRKKRRNFKPKSSEKSKKHDLQSLRSRFRATATKSKKEASRVQPLPTKTKSKKEVSQVQQPRPKEVSQVQQPSIIQLKKDNSKKIVLNSTSPPNLSDGHETVQENVEENIQTEKLISLNKRLETSSFEKKATIEERLSEEAVLKKSSIKAEEESVFEDEEESVLQTDIGDLKEEVTRISSDHEQVAVWDLVGDQTSESIEDEEEEFEDEEEEFEDEEEDGEIYDSFPQLSVELPKIDEDYSSHSNAPSASLLLQVKEGRAASLRRASLLLFFLIFIVGSIILISKLKKSPDPVPVNVVQNTFEARPLTPSQLQRLEENKILIVRRVKDSFHEAIKEGYLDMVTHLSIADREAFQAQEREYARRRAERRTRRRSTRRSPRVTEQVVQTSGSSDSSTRIDLDIRNPSPRPRLTGPGSEEDDLQGPGIHVQGSGRERHSGNGPGAEHFREGLRSDVQRSVQSCNQRHLTSSGALRNPRVTLSITVAPSGRVTSVSVNRDIRNTVFARCLESRIDRWRFGSFEGDSITLEQTYILD